MINEKFFQEILKSREDRADKQVYILNQYPYSLISFTLNTPGKIKDNELYRIIHKDGLKKILEVLHECNLDIKYSEEMNKSTGSEAFFSVDIDPTELKKLMVEIENGHSLGRIFDIDVFDKDHNQKGRSDLGLKPRKCLICNKDARVCMREKNHTYDDLISKIEELSTGYLR